jgi:Resolvase, N terminal domain
MASKPWLARGHAVADAAERGLPIVGAYVENESGAKLQRPELFRLLADSKPGDVLLVEQVDRLSRLTDADWRGLRASIDAKQVCIVALDLPTSWQPGPKCANPLNPVQQMTASGRSRPFPNPSKRGMWANGDEMIGARARDGDPEALDSQAPRRHDVDGR